MAGDCVSCKGRTHPHTHKRTHAAVSPPRLPLNCKGRTPKPAKPAKLPTLPHSLLRPSLAARAHPPQVGINLLAHLERRLLFDGKGVQLNTRKPSAP